MRYAAGAPCTVYVTEWQRRDSIQSIRFVTLTHSICITLILEFPSAYSSQFEIPLIVSGLKSHPASLSMSYGKRGCIIRPFLIAFTPPSKWGRAYSPVGSTKTTMTTKRCASCERFTRILNSKLYASPWQSVYLRRRATNYTARDLINYLTCNYRRVLSRGVLIPH